MRERESSHFTNPKLSATFSNILSYISTEDIGENELNDEYVLEDLDVSIADFVFPSSLSSSEYVDLWGSIGSQNQSVELLSLQDMLSIKGMVSLYSIY